MKIKSLFLNNRKIWLSITFGILSALLSKFGFETNLYNININIPWSPLLPILAAIAWGWRYGLLAGLTGGVYFPFILWPYDGWTNPITSTIFLGYFIFLGYIYSSQYIKNKMLWTFAAIAGFSFVIYLFDGLFFNKILAINPPFWEMETINQLPQELILSFALKDSVNILLLTFCAELFLRINIIRKLLGIQPLSKLKNNLKIFLATLSVFFLVWLTFTGLMIVFSEGSYSIQNNNSQIALLVFICSSIFTSRIIVYYSETHFKILDKLRESEEKYLTVFENLYDVLYITNMEGTVLEISPSIRFHFGYVREKIIGTSVYDFYFDAKARDAFLNVLQQDGVVNDYELEFKTNSNIKVYCSVNARLVFDENGKPKQVEGILRNITERKLNEEKIQINEQRFRKAQEVGKIGTFELDLINQIAWGSDEAKRIIGLELAAEYIPLIQTRDLFVDKEKTIALIEDAYKNSNSYNLEYDIFRYGTNERITINAIAEIKRDNEGKAVKVIGLIVDITERKRLEQELITAKEKAEESDRLKSAFLANMSHEIRTPMNGILGFSNLLKAPGLSGESQQEYIDLIEKSGARMLNTIQEIIDISKIESGQMKVNRTETNINEKVEFVYHLLKLDSEQKGIQLSFKNSLPDSKTKIITDSEKLYGILTNLVKNAIKYTDKGKIEFGYNLKGSSLEFYVKDTGIGIPEDRQNAIFERFIQADTADIEARQGAGLGLSIAKAYVEMLGERIWLESVEGEGTTFYFTIQYHPVFEKENIVRNNIPSSNEDKLEGGLKILIVEDDETSQHLISIIVKNFAKELLIAGTGIEAVEACKKNNDIDLVLMDIQMPGMNGYEATRQIRQFNKEVVIIAQTAFALAGDREKAIEIGCNDYISKPIIKDDLLPLIQKYVFKIPKN